MATKSGLGALGSTFEPSWGSWRLPEGSWRHLGALLAALGVLLERPQGHESARGELNESSVGDQGDLEEDQAAALGGVGEGFPPLSLKEQEGLKDSRDQRIAQVL